GATADDGDPVGDMVEIEDLVARQDRPAALEVRDQARHRTGGEDDVRSLDRRRRAVRHGDGDRATGPERPGAVEHLDLAALAHRRDATDEAVDDLALALLGDREIDDGVTGVDAEVGRVVDVTLHRSRLEERLGGDAPSVETGAA